MNDYRTLDAYYNTRNRKKENRRQEKIPVNKNEEWTDEHGNQWMKKTVHESLGVKTTTTLRNGKIHSKDGEPAVVVEFKSKVEKNWYVDGKRKREDDLPSVEIVYDNGSVHRWWYKGNLLHRDNDLPAETLVDGKGQTKKIWAVEGKVYASQDPGEKQRSVEDHKVFRKVKKEIAKKEKEARKTNGTLPSLASIEGPIAQEKQKERRQQEAKKAVQPTSGLRKVIRQHIKAGIEEKAESMGFQNYDAGLMPYLMLLRGEIDACSKLEKELLLGIKDYEMVFSQSSLRGILATQRVDVGQETIGLSFHLLQENNVAFQIRDKEDIDEQNIVPAAQGLLEKWNELKTNVVNLLEEFLAYPQHLEVGHRSETSDIASLVSGPVVGSGIEDMQSVFGYASTQDFPEDCRVRLVDGQARIFFLSNDKKGLNPVKEVWYSELQKTFDSKVIRSLYTEISNLHASMNSSLEQIAQLKSMVLSHLQEQALEASYELRSILNSSEDIPQEISNARSVLERFL